MCTTKRLEMLKTGLGARRRYHIYPIKWAKGAVFVEQGCYLEPKGQLIATAKIPLINSIKVMGTLMCIRVRTDLEKSLKMTLVLENSWNSKKVQFVLELSLNFEKIFLKITKSP